MVFCTAKIVTYFDVKANPDLLKGISLEIEGTDSSVKIPGGLTAGKNHQHLTSPFHLQNGYDVLLPRSTDYGSETLVDEDTKLDQFYNNYVKTSDLKKATFKFQGTTNYVLYSKDYSDYEKDGLLLNSKYYDEHSSEKDISKEFIEHIPGIDSKDVNAWMETFRPAIEQRAELIANGVYYQSNYDFLYTFNENSVGKKIPSMSLFACDYRNYKGYRVENILDNIHPKEFTEEWRKWVITEFKLALMTILGVKKRGVLSLYLAQAVTKEEEEAMKTVVETCANEIEKILKNDKNYQKLIQKIKSDKEKYENSILQRIQADNEKMRKVNDSLEEQKIFRENSFKKKQESEELRRKSEKSCVGSLLKSRPELHAEFRTKNEENVDHGQTLQAACQDGYYSSSDRNEDLKLICLNGEWFPNGGASKCFQNDSSASYAITMTVWLLIAALS